MIKALPGKVLVHNMTRGQQETCGGIVLLNDEGTSEGIHNRWAKVYSIGDGVEDISIGEWILIDHGRWSRAIDINSELVYLVDYPDGVLAAQKEKPTSTTVGEYQSYRSALRK